ncbi:MAG: peptide deformylase [Candidatus Dojkabacteria bacterium]|nr:MAG: peptide deformylase [Candidatus Dojkabacteria bacterium]
MKNVNFKYLTILQYPDPKLSAKSRDVRKNEPDLLLIIDSLKNLAKKHSKGGITLVGLSAPQLGLNIRLFVYYDLRKKQYMEVINPKLVYASKELSTEWEGCASVGKGENSLFGPVSRSKSCQIRYYDLAGNEQILNANGYLSHVILHELDHFEGIIFLDRVIDPKLIMTARELDEYALKHGGKYPEV